MAVRGSPSSIHAAGRAAKAVLERARDAVAAALGASSADVVATSGGSESITLAVLGLAPGATKVVTSHLEHPAVARAVDRREARGAAVVRAALRDVAAAVDAGVGLVVVQHANHETGEIAPLDEIRERCRSLGVPLVVDACQSFGKLPFDVAGITAVAVAASKIGGPAGAGALYVERGATLDPLVLGGAQERGRRAGAPGLVAWAGFGAAAGALDARLAAMPSISEKRDRLERGLLALGAVSNAPAERLSTVTNVSFRSWRGTALVAALDLEGLCASSGAACSSGLDTPSPVLLASFPDEPWRAASALRLSLGPETTDAEIDSALAIAQRVLARRA